MRFVFAMALFASSAAQAAIPAMSPSISMGPGKMSIYQINAAYQNTLASLQSQKEEQRKLDGGMLTPEHVAIFNKRFERADDLHSRIVRDRLSTSPAINIGTRLPAATN